MGLEYTALELWPRTEIEQQADRNAGGLQIIHQLNLMGRSQLRNGLQLDDDAFFDEKIRLELSDENATETHINRSLLDRPKPSLPQCRCKSIFVNALQKAGPKLVIDGVENANDPLGQLCFLQ